MLSVDKLIKYQCIDMNNISCLVNIKQFIDRLSITRGDIIKLKRVKGSNDYIPSIHRHHVEQFRTFFSCDWTKKANPLYQYHPYLLNNLEYIPNVCNKLDYIINTLSYQHNIDFDHLKATMISANRLLINVVYNTKNIFTQREKVIFERGIKANIRSIKEYLKQIDRQYSDYKLIIAKCTLGTTAGYIDKKVILDILKQQTVGDQKAPYGYIWKLFHHNDYYELLFFFIVNNYDGDYIFIDKINNLLQEKSLSMVKMDMIASFNHKKDIINEIINVFMVDYYLQLKSQSPKEKHFGKGLIKQRKKTLK